MWFIYFVNGFIDGAFGMAGLSLLILAPFYPLYIYLERKENE